MSVMYKWLNKKKKNPDSWVMSRNWWISLFVNKAIMRSIVLLRNPALRWCPSSYSMISRWSALSKFPLRPELFNALHLSWLRPSFISWEDDVKGQGALCSVDGEWAYACLRLMQTGLLQCTFFSLFPKSITDCSSFKCSCRNVCENQEKRRHPPDHWPPWSMVWFDLIWTFHPTLALN